MRPINRKKRPNRAYLIRCWQEGKIISGKAAHWRFSVEEILHKRCRQGFDGLEAFIAFMRAELAIGEDDLVEHRPSDESHN